MVCGVLTLSTTIFGRKSILHSSMVSSLLRFRYSVDFCRGLTIFFCAVFYLGCVLRSVNTKELVAGLVAAKSRTHGPKEEQVAGSSRRDKSQLSGREEKPVWFLRGRLLFHLLTGTCNTNKAHEGTSKTSPRATSGAN